MTTEATDGERLSEALAAHRCGDTAAAARIYRELLARDPRHADALHLLGLIEQQGGELAAAAAHVRAALAQRPDEPGFHFNLANILQAQGELAAAVEHYTRALALRPDDADTHTNLAAVKMQLGDSDEALAHFQAALRLSPDDPAVHYNLATVLKARNNPAASEHYERVVALQPDYAAAWNGLGVLRQEQGRLDEALDCYLQALRLDPGYAEAYNNMGTWQQERGALDQALGYFQQALACDADNAEAHNNCAVLLHQLGREADAMAGFRRAIALQPGFAAAHKNLGSLLAERGERAAAIACYREALRLAPDFSEARFKLAALTGEAMPAAAPADYVAALFDDYARDFDSHLVGTLNYRTPRRLRAVLEGRLPPGLPAVLDLGCGTGLSGEVFRDIAQHLVGIDLSAKMLARARERGIYDELIEGEALTAMDTLAQRFDLIVAADVLVYFGDLAYVFAAVARVLTPGGVFAFSVESNDAPGYALQPSGRYAHDPEYIETCAGACGFHLEHRESAVLRRERGEEVAGLLVILRAPAG